MQDQALQAKLEEIAKIILGTEADDLTTLAELHETFLELGRLARTQETTRIEKPLEALIALVENVILDTVDDPEESIELLRRSVQTLQQIARGDSPEDVDPFPPELAVHIESEASANNPGDRGPEQGGASNDVPVSLPPEVDRQIFENFVARQPSVLEGIEALLLTLENGPDEQSLTELRRIVHNLKGETALLGLGDVENLCHQIENVFDRPNLAEHIEGLLAAKDWLLQVFTHYRGESPHPGNAGDVCRALGLEFAEPASEKMRASSAGRTPRQDDTEGEGALPPPFDPHAGDQELLGDFVTEANEHLENADVHLLTLETDPHELDSLNAVFRAFHTIKGVAGFLNLKQILELSHEAENLLDMARKDEVQMAGGVIDVTFEVVDHLKSLFHALSKALTNDEIMEPDPLVPGWVSKIQAVARGEVHLEQEDPQADAGGKPLGAILVDRGTLSQEALGEALDDQASARSQERLGDIIVNRSMASRQIVEEAGDSQRKDGEDRPLGQILEDAGAISKTTLDDALRIQQSPSEDPKLGEVLVRTGKAGGRDVAQALRSQQEGAARNTRRIREPVKVDADRLDSLLDTIGELVIAESMVSQLAAQPRQDKGELLRRMGQLDKITREIQEEGMSLRMVPLRSTFQKMARLVRDLAKKSGKQVNFVVKGEDTELDKSMVDNIGDPLVHMIRNAVDHGLEDSPAKRREGGKSDEGRVDLRAYYKGGSIVIEIEDDGRGLNRDRILQKAKERGLIERTDDISDRDVFNLIFEPGFSTAKKVTDVSGRGVGMDVVRRNIESLRGHVEIQSQEGKGTLFSIRLPLTLAIIDGMVVRAGKERYVIPTLSIVQSLRPRCEDLSTVLKDGTILQFQDTLVPFFCLGALFDIPDAIDDPLQGLVVVVEHDDHQVGIVVDELLGQHQIVIKSLGKTMQGISGLSGGAIMPDGNVGLILDVGGLVDHAYSDNGPNPLSDEGQVA